MMDTTKLPYSKQAISGVKHPDRLSPEQFRNAVWIRDGAKDRARGTPLVKGDPNWDLCGEVAHLRTRGAYPELATDPNNAVLLSTKHHWLSDGRGGTLLKLTDPETGAPATDASKPIRFTMFDRKGVKVWEYIS